MSSRTTAAVPSSGRPITIGPSASGCDTEARIVDSAGPYMLTRWRPGIHAAANPGQRLAAGGNENQSGHVGRVHRAQRRRGDDRVRRRAGADHRRELVATEHVGGRDDERAAAEQRPHHLHDGGVEAGRGDVQYAGSGTSPIKSFRARYRLAMPRCGTATALGAPGRSGREDDVGDVIGRPASRVHSCWPTLPLGWDAVSASICAESIDAHSMSVLKPASSTRANPQVIPASASIPEMRSDGRRGSTGTNAAPALTIAQTATTDSSDRRMPTATASPGPTPRLINHRAKRLTPRRTDGRSGAGSLDSRDRTVGDTGDRVVDLIRQDGRAHRFADGHRHQFGPLGRVDDLDRSDRRLGSATSSESTREPLRQHLDALPGEQIRRVHNAALPLLAGRISRNGECQVYLG